MGMAPPKTTEIKKPKYKGTVVCQSCGAEFKESPHWHRVHYPVDTTDTIYRVEGKVKENQCPMCLKDYK